MISYNPPNHLACDACDINFQVLGTHKNLFGNQGVNRNKPNHQSWRMAHLFTSRCFLVFGICWTSTLKNQRDKKNNWEKRQWIVARVYFLDANHTFWSCQILRIHPHEGTGLKLIHSVYISEALRPGAVTPLMLFRVVFLDLLTWHLCCSWNLECFS